MSLLMLNLRMLDQILYCTKILFLFWSNSSFVCAKFLYFLSVDIPKITKNPESQSVATGADTVFKVEARGDDLKFQWRKDDTDIESNESRLCCSRTRDTSTLHIQHAMKCDKGRYRCVVKNQFGVGGKLSLEADLLVCKFDIFNIANG